MRKVSNFEADEQQKTALPSTLVCQEQKSEAAAGTPTWDSWILKII